MSKKTKKIVVVLVSIVLICGTLAACGGGSSEDPIVGKWKMSSAEAMGQTVSIEDYLAVAGTDEVPAFEFKANNTLTATGMMGQDGSGKWEATDTGYSLSDGGSQSLTATIVDGKLHIEAGGATLIFSKE